VGHDLACDCRKQNPAPKMTGGKKEAGRRGRGSQDGQEILGRRTQTRPRLTERYLTESRHHLKRRGGDFAKTGQGDSVVEASFFHRRAREDSSIAARHQVTTERKDRGAQRLWPCLETGDLPAHRVGFELVGDALNLTRPCTGRADNDVRLEYAPIIT